MAKLSDIKYRLEYDEDEDNCFAEVSLEELVQDNRQEVIEYLTEHYTTDLLFELDAYQKIEDFPDSVINNFLKREYLKREQFIINKGSGSLHDELLRQTIESLIQKHGVLGLNERLNRAIEQKKI